MKKQPHKLMKSLAENITELRESLEITQTTLAKKSGISKAMISLLERGMRSDVQLQTLHNLALGLGCEVHHLLYGVKK